MVLSAFQGCAIRMYGAVCKLHQSIVSENVKLKRIVVRFPVNPHGLEQYTPGYLYFISLTPFKRDLPLM